MFISRLSSSLILDEAWTKRIKHDGFKNKGTVPETEAEDWERGTTVYTRSSISRSDNPNQRGSGVGWGWEGGGWGVGGCYIRKRQLF